MGLSGNLHKVCENYGLKETLHRLDESFKDGTVKPTDFSLRELAESFMGRDWVNKMRPNPRGGFMIMEAGDAVDSTAFSNITGQIVYNMVLQGYNRPEFIGDRLMRRVTTQFESEKVAGVANIDDAEANDDIKEGMPYPRAGLSEDYLETPKTTKKGLIIPVTKEAVFYDRVNQVDRQARGVGYVIRLRKEKKQLRVVGGIDNTYKRRGTVQNTYQTVAGADPYVNRSTGVQLVDWTDIDEALQLAAELTNPFDTEANPIVFNPRTILVMPAKKFVARRIVNATETRTTSGTNETLAPSPVQADVEEVLSSALLYQILKADSGFTEANVKDMWFLGDFMEAFNYFENWPLTVVQASDNSDAEFEADIVLQFKASEKGVPVVIEPRAVLSLGNAFA